MKRYFCASALLAAGMVAANGLPMLLAVGRSAVLII